MEIEIDEALMRSDLVFIDVRSPGEFAESSIPGSVNIPLFDNREHRRLGIVYHRQGEHQARREALNIVAPRLPALVDNITDTCGDRIPLLYCRRGGMRSLSLYQVLSLTGITVLRLKQGYKAYRRYVRKRLSDYNLKSRLVVLHGLTGVGKTTLIKELEHNDIPVIDLEGIARHRGSVFGAVGPDSPRSQKDFDALLLYELDCIKDEPYIIVEGEGRKIGNVYLPKFLVEAMQEGHQLLLEAPLKTRVDRIMEAYNPDMLTGRELNELKAALESLRRRLGNKKVDILMGLLDKEDYREVARILCVEYYDHYYSDSRPESADFDYRIDATDLAEAAKSVEEIISDLSNNS
ncbi:MAG: tRNA 2-selenouridine(34) synthase MnmH [Bacillota bacterium]|nr:tRNA 2-selenouridine(34) synthase MnmH [Bacillota bacterium]